MAVEEQPSGTRLVVFADDWGRHPSSCQHLLGKLLPRHQALWVNTIGTRLPKLTVEDLKKVAVKLKQWSEPAGDEVALPPNLDVVNPKMWPGFRARWQRAFNASSIARTVNRSLGPRAAGERRVAVTTLPITADLVGRLDVDTWVYYCVDDFSVWPGLDGPVIDAMERQLVGAVDQVIAVSDTLQTRMAEMGRESSLLTHGIDLEHWQTASSEPVPPWWPEGPTLLFWGVIDPRLDASWCTALADEVANVVLVGPQQDCSPILAQHPRITMPGPMPYAALPALAQRADALVMPYDDLPVTRAIQPLKLKEYLATGRPAIVRALPATVHWSDAADIVASKDALIAAARERLTHGLDEGQRTVRERTLSAESWAKKADEFAALAEL